MINERSIRMALSRGASFAEERQWLTPAASAPMPPSSIPEILLAADEREADLVVQSALSQCTRLEDGDSIIGGALLGIEEEEEEEEEEGENGGDDSGEADRDDEDLNEGELEEDGTQEDLFEDLPQIDGTADSPPARKYLLSFCKFS